MVRKKKETKLERLEYENSMTLRWAKCQRLASVLYRSEIPTCEIDGYIQAIHDETVNQVN
jgi:hypothetical protein